MHCNDAQERRKSPRSSVEKGVIALTTESSPLIATLIDISQNGLAFTHISPIKLTGEILDIDVLAMQGDEGKDLFLNNVKGKVISVLDLQEDAFDTTLLKKRYGLKFENLTALQNIKIQRFIERNRAGNLL